MTDIPVDLSKLVGDDKIRFHVVDAEERQRSSDWIIWSHAGSLYAAVAKLGGVIKLSLHPRGEAGDGNDSQYSTTSEYRKTMQSLGFSGALPFHRWKRPDLEKNRISKVVSITFPTDHLSNIVTPSQFKYKKFACSLPGKGKAVELAILTHMLGLDIPEDFFVANSYTPWVSYELQGGEYATIAGRIKDFTAPIENLIPTGAVGTYFGSAPLSGHTIEGAHTIIGTLPKDGERLYLIETNGFAIAGKNDS